MDLLTVDSKMARRGEWVYDELLNYVSSPLFRAPVLGFMENSCLIFDPSLDDCKEYRELHGGYCALVTVLLDAFREDTNLTHDQVIRAMTEMSKKADLREVFSGVFELILATESFKLFTRLMTQQNLELQQQALMLIMQQSGQIPDVMKPAKPSAPPNEPKSQSKPSPQAPPPSLVKQQDDEIMQSIIKTTSANKKQDEATPKDMQKSAEAESQLIRIEKKKEEEKLAEVMKDLKFEEPPPKTQPPPAVLSNKSRETANLAPLPRLTCHVPPPTPTEPVIKVTAKPTAPAAAAPSAAAGGGDAAAMWIAQAKAENNQETMSAVQTAAATFASLSSEELKKRQAYLKEQREKLMELKQKEREKQLSKYEQAAPSRPKSARAARSLMSRAPDPADTDAAKKKEDEKTMEMRKAIAQRLKVEVLGKSPH